MDRQIVLSESLGITTSVGAIIRLIAFVVAAVIGYTSLRSDLNSAIEQGKHNAAELTVTQDKLDNARMDLRGLDSKFDQFLRNYETDMRRYIRNDNDRR